MKTCSISNRHGLSSRETRERRRRHKLSAASSTLQPCTHDCAHCRNTPAWICHLTSRFCVALVPMNSTAFETERNRLHIFYTSEVLLRMLPTDSCRSCQGVSSHPATWCSSSASSRSGLAPTSGLDLQKLACSFPRPSVFTNPPCRSPMACSLNCPICT